MDNLQRFGSLRNKCFVDISIILVFFKSGIQYMWQGEISVCKVLVPVKVVLVKNDYFLFPKFELRKYHQINGFLYWCSFYWKKYGACISHNLIVRLIQTWIWYDQLTVNQIWPSNHGIIWTSFNFVSLNYQTTWSHHVAESCFDVFVFTLNNESKSKQHEMIFFDKLI